MMVAEKMSEAAEIRGQLTLYPELTVSDLDKTLDLLKKYCSMRANMQDYEKFRVELEQTAVEGETARRISSEEYYANKTANAVILMEKQLAIYQEYKERTRYVERAVGLIIDEDERKAVHYRYLMGHRYKEMILFFQRSMSDRTIERKLQEGIVSVANTLKLWGVLDAKWKY